MQTFSKSEDFRLDQADWLTDPVEDCFYTLMNMQFEMFLA